MTTTYGYIRTSRQRIQGTAGSDPEAQARQLLGDGVPAMGPVPAEPRATGWQRGLLEMV